MMLHCMHSITHVIRIQLAKRQLLLGYIPLLRVPQCPGLQDAFCKTETAWRFCTVLIGYSLVICEPAGS